MSKYEINLCYGYHECEDGVYHSFHAEDPEETKHIGWVGAHLAGLLDTTIDDDRFNWGCMYIDLPKTIVERIKQEAVLEYQNLVNEKTFAAVSWNREDIEKALEDLGYKHTKENIESVWDAMEHGHSNKVVERMIEYGWGAIYDVIDYVIALDEGKGWEKSNEE